MPNKPLVPFRQARLVPRSGGIEIVRIGNAANFTNDLYANLLASSWARLFTYIAFVYVFANLLFACLYMSFPGSILNDRPDSFQDAFFFSVQTMATIGYGHMVPIGLSANILVAIEALFGFAFFAIITGMVFAKLSRPTARVLFSDVAVIGPYDGKPHLMMRMANERGNRIVDATVHLVVLMDERTQEGNLLRRFHDLSVVRERVPFMQYTWTVMHCIDESSKLYGMTQESLRNVQAEIILSMTGHDDVFEQTVHARHSYITDEIRTDAVFEDVLKREEGRLEINFHKFHQTKPYRSTDA